MGRGSEEDILKLQLRGKAHNLTNKIWLESAETIGRVFWCRYRKHFEKRPLSPLSIKEDQNPPAIDWNRTVSLLDKKHLVPS